MTRYAHLVKTLSDMTRRGVRAYVGTCCGHFFVKRQRTFQEPGIPAVLTDIESPACHTLKQEQLAYAGEFKAEARLDAGLLEKMWRRIAAPKEVSCSP